MSFTCGSLASARITSRRNCGPSNHQWPKSSASNGATHTPGRPVTTLWPPRTSLTIETKCWALAVDDLLDGGGVVGLLVGERDAVAGDAVVAEAALAVLAVELEVGGVAGVAELAAPDLFAHAGVAGEGEGARGLGLAGDADGFERAAPAAFAVPVDLGVGGLVERAVLQRAQRPAAADEVGVDEEVGHAGRGDELLDADAVARVVVEHGRHPVFQRRPVRALGQPHAGGLSAEVAFTRHRAARHLRPAHLVVQQQRHVRVRRVAREHLDEPLAEMRGERAGMSRPIRSNWSSFASYHCCHIVAVPANCFDSSPAASNSRRSAAARAARSWRYFGKPVLNRSCASCSSSTGVRPTLSAGLAPSAPSRR